MELYVVGEIALLDSAQRPRNYELFETRYYELLARGYALVEVSGNEAVFPYTEHA